MNTLNANALSEKVTYSTVNSKNGEVYVPLKEVENKLAEAMTPVKKKRAYKPQPVYQVVRKAMRLFLKQLKPDIQAKKDCLRLALAQSPLLYEDQLRFYMDFKAERERLLDSKKFNEACMALKLDATAVADNVVFEGKRVLESVLKEGLHVVGEKVHMFNGPLWEDSEKLYAGNQFPTAPANEQSVEKEGAND